MLELVAHATIEEFLGAAEDALSRDEVTNSLILGIAQRIRQHPERLDCIPYLATVRQDDATVAAAVMTPPHGVVVSAVPTDPAPAMQLVVRHLLADGWTVPSVNGVTTVSTAFAIEWMGETGGIAELVMQLRVFELRRVNAPPPPLGQFRQATMDDADLVYAWYLAFHAEAAPNDVTPKRPNIDFSVEQGNIFLWEVDGRPVSLAGRGRRTAHGVSVGPVYTPPEARGRGYASACVAALSQHILDTGAEFCTLFTDLANPTSNHIYQTIGYRPVNDFAKYALRDPVSRPSRHV